MSILVNKDSKVLVQGITGSEGQFHSVQMLDYGTNIVSGVTPGKGGQNTLDGKVPVFNTVEEAVKNTYANTSIIFVPPSYAAEAVIEASYAGISLVVCITEGVPVHDMLKAKRIINQNGTRLIGPNCPGIITVDECKLGIMPGFICKKGNIGVISKSGTLTYEAIDQLVNVGLGQTTAIGIGGDPINGSSFKDMLEKFETDDETKTILMIGEIGGPQEAEAAQFVKENVSKPVIAYIAGLTAPKGKRMGHAGAIVTAYGETAAEKVEILQSAGITIAKNPSVIGDTIASVIK